MDNDSSTCVGHESCPKCGSRDNLARYSDGHGHCFGCGFYEHATGEPSTHKGKPKMSLKLIPLQELELRPLEKRKLKETTCEKWGYGFTHYKNKPVQVANYKDEQGTVVAQQLRFANKDFKFLGELNDALPLYGQHLWRDGGKKIVICEGQIDAMSLSQMQDHKWPVVSIPNGVKSAKKAIGKAIEWLITFDEVVFMFDNDKVGRDAAIECAQVIPVGRASIATLPLKDANEMLVAGRGKEVIQAMWDAKPYRPDGLVTLSDLKEEIKKPVEWGLPWLWDFLTEASYGRQDGGVYLFGAGTGVGKTDFFTQQIAYDMNVLNLPVGIFFFEQQPKETLLRLAGKVGHKRFHVPDAGWTEEELDTTIDEMEQGGKVTLYNHWGGAEWETVVSRIRFMAATGTKLFYIDHLTALAAASYEDEKTALESIMAEVASLAQELQIIVHMISHLATPEGTPHEEGGRVSIRHFKGSRAIGFWSHFMFGFERNQQAEDENERQTTTFRILKDRWTGQSTGKTFFLGYDVDTGLLYPTDKPKSSDNSSVFADESSSSNQDF